MGSKQKQSSDPVRPQQTAPDRGASGAGGAPAFHDGTAFNPGVASRLQGALGNSGVSAMIQRKSSASSAGGDPPGDFNDATSGASSALPFRPEMEASFGQDFSGVDAHLGQAGPMASMNANAAASGESLAFASGSPSKRLVAHELTHVVQQRQGGSGVQLDAAVSAPGDASEREADAAAAQVVSGRTVQVSAAPSAGVQLDGEGVEEAPEEAELTPMEQWDELLNDPANTGEEILSWAAWQWENDQEIAIQLLTDVARRGKILAKVGAQGAPTLMVYWHVGLREDLGLDQAVLWCKEAGGLDSAGWARLVAGETAEQCARVLNNAESLQVVRGLPGDPVVLFPALSEDPLALQQLMSTSPDFVTWLRDVGGESRVQQIRDYCKLATDAAAERQRLVDAGQWTAHLAALPDGPSTDQAVSQQLYRWFLAEDQVAHMATLFEKRYGIDLTTAANEVEHDVVEGDTLSRIARSYLGDGSRWPEIYDYGDNKATIGDDPNLILPGQTLTIYMGQHDWDHASIQRTWVICDKLPPADVALTVEIMREGSTGGAGGAAGGGEITMSWGTDQIGDVDTGAFTEDDDPMRGLNIFDGTLRHEIGHGVGDQGFDSPSGWVGGYGWVSFESGATIAALFRDTFMPAHPMPLAGVSGDKDAKRTQILNAIAGVSEWSASAFETAVNGVEEGLWDQVASEDLITYILSRVENWGDPDDIGGTTYHAPYETWGNFWQGCPASLNQNKVSTYAMRSSMEWFAEVYACFYSDADRPDGQVGTLLETRDAALARDFRTTIHGRHNLAAETNQTVGAPATHSGT